MAKIRILLIDDHNLFRESLRRLLEVEPDFQIAGSCDSIAGAFSVLDHKQVDIVLLDYEFGEGNGLQLLEGLQSRNLECRVLMVTAALRDDVVLDLLRNGSSGIFFKHSPPAQLIEAIHRVVGGQTWLDAKIIHTILATTAAKKEEKPGRTLNRRERAVLTAVFEGHSNKTIAARLNTTEGTVKAVMQQLFDKTGVRTRSQLVRVALEKRVQEWPPESEHERS
jgi:two-component system, NarL family, nitrate/nitrite response regulator NarL